MKGEKRHIVLMRRGDVELTVVVGHQPGYAPTWWEPGEPDQFWIVEATDQHGETVELPEDEKARAVKHAAAGEVDEPPPEEPPITGNLF